MFVFSFIIFHLIDRCTRWHAACLVTTKEERVLIDALDSLWIGIHGPMRELFMDGESGMAASGYAKQSYDRHGIKFIYSSSERAASGTH